LKTIDQTIPEQTNPKLSYNWLNSSKISKFKLKITSIPFKTKPILHQYTCICHIWYYTLKDRIQKVVKSVDFVVFLDIISEPI